MSRIKNIFHLAHGVNLIINVILISVLFFTDHVLDILRVSPNAFIAWASLLIGSMIYVSIMIGILSQGKDHEGSLSMLAVYGALNLCLLLLSVFYGIVMGDIHYSTSDDSGTRIFSFLGIFFNVIMMIFFLSMFIVNQEFRAYMTGSFREFTVVPQSLETISQRPQFFRNQTGL